MLRTVLMGFLAFSTASACKGKTDAPAVQPGVTAGTVVELAGVVTATRGAAKRALAVGQEISGDDIIETGPDGRVRLLIAHNNATWDLGPNRRETVGDSLAWKMPKQAAPTAVSEATLAAGRHAERETVTTVNTAPAPAAQTTPVPAPGAPDPGAAPTPTPPSDEGKMGSTAPRRRDVPKTPGLGEIGTVGRGGGDSLEKAPPKGVVEQQKAPPKTESSRIETKEAPTAPAKTAAPKDVGRNDSRPDIDSPPPPPPPAGTSKADVIREIARHRDALAACVGPGTTQLTVIVAKGKTTFEFAGMSEKAKTCLGVVAAKITFPADFDLKAAVAIKGS